MLYKNLTSFHFIAIFAVIGLFTSLVHYHSEGLECLDHAEETHFIQTVDYCPVCTLVSDVDFKTPLSFDGFLVQKDSILEVKLAFKNPFFSSSKFGRAPPFMA